MNQTLSNHQLIERLGSPNRAEQYEAYKALFAQGQAVLDDAVRGLKHANPEVRRCCADLMDHLADDRCVPPLLDLIKDEAPRVRRQAVHSLACQRCKPIPLAAFRAPAAYSSGSQLSTRGKPSRRAAKMAWPTSFSASLRGRTHTSAMP